MEKTVGPKEASARRVLLQMSGLADDDLRPEMELVSELGIDSPKALELLVELEEALGLDDMIPDEDAARMETVGDVLAYAAAMDG